MRKLIVGAFMSLDGVMQAPGGPEEDPTGGFKYGGWTAPYFDEAAGEWLSETFSKPYALLLGRKTYEIFAAYWPFYEGGPDNEIARQFNSVAKYVATSSKAPLTWQNSTAIHDAANDVRKLKEQAGPDLLVQGSANLIQTLLKHGLVDQFNLLVFPLLLGRGKRLFAEGTQGVELKLTSSRTSPSGVTMNSYTPSGPVRTGSFGPDKPSEAEKARREKMQRER